MPPLKKTAPVVTKTTMAPKSWPREPTPGDSVWESLDAMKMLIYGESGSGKTTLAGDFPGPTRWLICSGSDQPGELRSINTPEHREKITPVVIRSTDDLKRELASGTRYATNVLDHATGLADLVLKEILGLSSIPVQKAWGLASQQQYGQQALQLKTFFHGLLNLPGHVLIIAQQRTFGGKGEEGGGDSELIKPTVGAALSPSVAGWLGPACDFVVQTFKRQRMKDTTRTIGGKEIVIKERDVGIEYCLRTAPHDLYLTKFRIPKGRDLPECLVDPSYEAIHELIYGKV